MQQQLLAAYSRQPLPTLMALALLDAAAQIREHLTWTPPTRHIIAAFRAMLVVCSHYAFFRRASS
jgi:hypothetical protein